MGLLGGRGKFYEDDQVKCSKQGFLVSFFYADLSAFPLIRGVQSPLLLGTRGRHLYKWKFLVKRKICVWF